MGTKVKLDFHARESMPYVSVTLAPTYSGGITHMFFKVLTSTRHW